MKFDFDSEINRLGTNSVKWNLPHPDVIPLWVADMDFAVAPVITQALKSRISHPIFGYVHVPEEFYQATINWFKSEHNWTIERDWMIYTTGVVPALSAVIKAMTQPGDKVLLLTPVYNCFFSSVRNNGCETAECALRYTGDTYEVDYEAFDRMTADPACKLFVLCNPHNPAGRVWRRDELQRMADIAIRNNVVIVSDEIHNELTMPGYDYVPMASLSPEVQSHTITCISPSKSFNTAALQIANIVTSNPEWRQRIDRAINVNETCDVNPFGVEALIAAYSPEGKEWLQELRQYLWGNYQALCDFFARELPQLTITKLEGTYLVWVNIKPLGLTSDQITERLLNDAHVWVNSGTMYGQRDGEGFIRINIACPRSRLLRALTRLAPTLRNL